MGHQVKRLGVAMLGVTGFALAIAGCATTGGGAASDVRAQVGTLQTQVAALTSQVEELRSRQRTIEDRTWDQGMKVTPAAESPTKRGRVVLTAKEIQLALHRAGYYHGALDGHLGPKTRVAIKAFQSANSLVADGVAGTKTMIALQAYLTPASTTTVTTESPS